MGQGMIRVDRGDGRLFQFRPNDVDAFVKANPGAKVVVSPTPGASPTAAEAAATAALHPGGGPDLASMTVAQLKAHAAEHDIDLDGATVKADIIERIEDAPE